MKIMFISDIHGSIKFLNKAISRFIEEEADKLVILGDIIEGPYAQPDYFYNPVEVVQLLNEYKDKIIAIRGNCDREADQRLFEFSILNNYEEIQFEGRKVFATHGHLYSKGKMPKLNQGDIFIQGHLHIPIAEIYKGIYYLNPGSISLPRDKSKNSYGVLVNNKFFIKDLEGGFVKELEIN